VNNAKFILQVSKGLIRDQHARRLVMFYSVLLALVMLFAGSTVLWNFLRDHPVAFLCYWAVCAWITFLAVLLALYDVVKVRADASRIRRELEREYLAKQAREARDENAS
jgi:uncharacterized membrane protein